MSTSVLLALAATLSTATPDEPQNQFDAALSAPSGYVYRAQTPVESEQPATSSPLMVPPPQGTTTYYPPAYTDPNGAVIGGGTVVQPFGDPAYPTPITQDPWLGGAMSPAAPTYGYGVFGPQPQRFGWESRFDVTWIPDSGTSNPDVGDLTVWGIDWESEYTAPTGPGWTYSMAPQFNYRSLQGPIGDATRQLPGSVFRFGLDLAAQTTSHNGCTLEFGFTPALATDFDASISSDSFQWDARAVAYWRVAPQWMWVLGATYWDRKDDIVLPYVGAVWTPDDRWELRMLFPKSRISYFMGTPNGVPTWLYVEGAYHVESYEVQLPNIAASDNDAKVQFSDIRVLGGLRWEAGWVTTFIEAGYVFNREVDYATPGSSFDVDDQFIGRLGFRY